jgi:hypothetical protein
VPCDAFLATYAARVTSERLPTTIATRVVEVVPRDRGVAELRTAIEDVRSLAAPPPSRFIRRVAFVWLRIFVLSVKKSKRDRVDVRIPIPVPLIGTLFAHGLTRQQALKALALAEASDDPAAAVSDYLDSAMGFELIRVDERLGPEKRELVVIGFD